MSLPLHPRSRAALTALAALCILACAERLARRSDAPQQGWWDERGPVVPHDSFPADCSLCHVSDGWHEIRADFAYDHAAETGVALEGAHARAECLRCHNDRGPVAAFAARGCAGCHEDVHQGDLGTDCSACHDERSWETREAIAMHDRTRFPLVGAHAAVACWRCHIGAEVGNFTPLDTECLTCHADDLARATEPDHVAAGFTTDCDRCHVPTSWTGRGFNHPGFPLTGAHRALDCDACHAGGTYAGTPSDCFACHADDYAATTDPDHELLGFPTSCETCHGTQRWEGARFNHSFSITSGPHAGLDCIDCHTVPTATPQFSCIDCHEHAQPETDADHDEVPGYAYASSACLQCHPTGRE